MTWFIVIIHTHSVLDEKSNCFTYALKGHGRDFGKKKNCIIFNVYIASVRVNQNLSVSCRDINEIQGL